MPKGVYTKKLGVHGTYVRTPEIRAKIAESVRDISRVNAQDPEWRQNGSEATKVRMHDPAIRQRHLDGLARAREASPSGSTWKGEQGQEPNELERSYAGLLELGYVSNFPVHVTKATHEAPPVRCINIRYNKTPKRMQSLRNLVGKLSGYVIGVRLHALS